MDQLPAWAAAAVTITGALGSIVTAVATFFLWRVTKTLAKETKRLAEASAQPHVVATLEPNQWSMSHFDLHVDNMGNATAYDIKISFDPPLPNGRPRPQDRRLPFQDISVLKPGQGLSSHLAPFEDLADHVYGVTVSWKRNASDTQRETNTYSLSIAAHIGGSRLGEDNPLVEIAKRIKAIEEAWGPVAKGSKRTGVNVYGNLDRMHERRQVLRHIARSR